MNRKKIAALVAPVMVSSAVHAQILEEIVVVAQKRAQNANDIGVSVNAFTDEHLEALGIQEATDVMAFTPGATLTSSGQGIPIYTIRGIGFDDYNSNSSSTVGINIDEVALPYPIMTRVPQYDVERVEVLKGPQGTLYGQNTTGGTINFIHRKPDISGNSVGIETSLDSDSKISVRGFANGVVSDELAVRLSFFTEQGGGWQENAAFGSDDDDHGDQDKLALRFQANWVPMNNLEINFKADYHRDESDNIVPQHISYLTINPDADPSVLSFLESEMTARGLPDSGNPDAASWNIGGNTFGGQNPDGDFDRDNDGLLLSLRVDWELSFATLTSLTAFNDYSRDEANNWDGVAVSNWDSYNRTDIEMFSQELRLTSNGTGRLQWIAGLYYAEDEVDEISTGSGEYSSPQLFITPGNLDAIFGGGGAGDLNGDGVVDTDDVHAAAAGFDLFSTTYRQETSTMGAFVHTEYELSEMFSVTAGLRYTRDEREIIDSCTHDVDGVLAWFFQEAIFGGFAQFAQGDCLTVNPATFVPGPFNETIKSNNVSGKIGLDFRPNQDHLIYANVSTGYKSGGFGAPAAASWDSLASYDEEEVTSYELGIKSTLLNSSLQLNASLYLYDYEDKQVSAFIIDPVFGSLTKIVNAPESTVKGAELELNWYANERTLVRLTSAYLNAEYDDFASILFGQSLSATNNTPIDLSGDQIQNTPEFQHNLMIHHDIPVNDRLRAFVGGDLAYSDEFNALVGGHSAFDVDSYTVANLRFGVADMDERWQLTGWVRNLTDKDYYTGASASNDSIVRLLGRERTYGLSFRYTWD